MNSRRSNPRQRVARAAPALYALSLSSSVPIACLIASSDSPLALHLEAERAPGARPKVSRFSTQYLANAASSSSPASVSA